MDHRADVSDFLRTRRDRLTPDRAGILGRTPRRGPGLPREEADAAAGISVENSGRHEPGDLPGVSVEARDALARTLLQDEAETDHLHDLAAAAGPPARRRPRPADRSFPDTLQRFLDAVSVPVWVRDRRMDVVAANPVGRAL